MRAISNCLLMLVGACAWNLVDAAESEGTNNYGILGGTPANITEVPYMALFRVVGVTWGCGAVIVSDQFLVTSANCDTTILYQVRITVGTDYIVGGKEYRVKNIFRHPQYDESSYGYNLAVVQLREKLTFSDRVKSIKLADSNLVPAPGDTMMAVGFGVTEDKKFSKQLLKVDIPYVDREECKKIFKLDDLITEQMICAGGKAGKNVSPGDNGGPLVYKGSLIGVTTLGVDPFPSIFAYVPSMLDFINNVIKNN